MKFKVINEEYVRHSTRASDVIRQLAYAGIAAVWVLRTGQERLVLPADLILAASLFAFAAALLADVLQYAIQTYKWKQVALDADRVCSTDDDEYPVDESIHHWPSRMFWIKSILVGAGYLSYIVTLIAQASRR